VSWAAAEEVSVLKHSSVNCHSPSGVSLRLLVLTINIASLLVLALLGAEPAESQTFTVLHTFLGGVGDGGNPFGGLVRDSAGNVYGTTEDNGAGLFCPLGCGIVFKLDSVGQETVLHNFAGGSKDGSLPYYGDLLLGAAGNLYGTTYQGGAFGAGTVYEVTPTGEEKVIYSFRGRADGGFPWGGLIHDAAGNLYGTTSGRGSGKACAYGCGTVFKLDRAGGFTLLHTFVGGTDGEYPLSRLLRDGAGNLYGTTEQGGGSGCGGAGCGTVFKIDTSGKESILYAFAGPPDGQFPVGGLILDKVGNLYGTTFQGGFNGIGGTVFKVDPTGKETVLYSFNLFGGDAGLPYGGLVRDSAGNLYGATSSGGAAFGGAIFEVNASGVETVLYSFTGGSDGYIPFSDLIRDAAGNLYGTTSEGGDASCFCGVVFQLTP